MLRAESEFIVEELSGSHKLVYNYWKKSYSNGNDAVYNAGDYIARKYEIPKNIEEKAPQRAKNSVEIYSIMMKK